jgi:fructoselysine 6-kinase
LKSGQAFPGGNAVNVAVYLSRLGIPVSYVGVVGDDEYGQLLIQRLKEKNVDTSHVRIIHGQTAVTMVEIVNGDRVFGDYFEGVLADFKLTDEDISFLLQQDLIHTAFWGKVEKDLWRFKGKGPLVSFDFADKLESRVIDETLPYVDYAFFAYEQEDDFIKEYLRKAQSKGPKVAVATLNVHGSIAYDGTGFTRFGIIPVDVVDTMGAGDSYIAAFLYGVLNNLPLEKCMELGAKSSAETLKYSGAW